MPLPLLRLRASKRSCNRHAQDVRSKLYQARTRLVLKVGGAQGFAGYAMNWNLLVFTKSLP